jgi:hypothetical protein
MSHMGLEPLIPMFQNANTVRASIRTAIELYMQFNVS